MAGSSGSSKKLTFAADEKVLCFHGRHLYEARILDAQMKTDDHGVEAPAYHVHYKSWASRWDEWVPESRVLKWTEANLQRQKELIVTVKSKKSMALSGRKRAAADSKLGKRRKQDKDVETEEEYASRVEVKIPLPDELKQKLAEDWDLITHQHKQIKLPCKITITKFFEGFLAQTRPKAGKPDPVLAEVAAGLKLYFEEAIGTMLLYKSERPQYEAIVKGRDDDRKMCDVYGPEHLLRLFVKLPALLVHTKLDERAMSQLGNALQDVLKYMKRANVFANEHEAASA